MRFILLNDMVESEDKYNIYYIDFIYISYTV